MKFFTFGSKDIGIDLGTANILVTLKGKGIVLKEPSVVAIDRKSGNIMATGNEAKEMLGRTPEQIKAVRPLKDGVIADFTATQLMLKNIIGKVEKRYSIGRPRVVVGVPSKWKYNCRYWWRNNGSCSYFIRWNSVEPFFKSSRR